MIAYVSLRLFTSSYVFFVAEWESLETGPFAPGIYEKKGGSPKSYLTNFRPVGSALTGRAVRDRKLLLVWWLC